MLSQKILYHLRTSALPLCIALSVTLCSPPLLHSAEERSYSNEIQHYVAEDKVYLLENIRQNITRPSEKTVVDALLCESGPQAIELFQKQLRDYPDPSLDQLSTSRIAAYRVALDSSAPLPKLSRPLPVPKQQVAAEQGRSKPPVASIQDKPNQDIASHQTPLPETSAGTKNLLPLPMAVRQKLESTPAPPYAQERPKSNGIPLSSPLPEIPKQKATIARTTGYTLQFGAFKNKENAEALTKKISLYEPAEIIVQGLLHRVLLKKKYASIQEAETMMKKLPFVSIIFQAKEGQN